MPILDYVNIYSTFLCNNWSLHLHVGCFACSKNAASTYEAYDIAIVGWLKSRGASVILTQLLKVVGGVFFRDDILANKNLEEPIVKIHEQLVDGDFIVVQI